MHITTYVIIATQYHSIYSTPFYQMFRIPRSRNDHRKDLWAEYVCVFSIQPDIICLFLLKIQARYPLIQLSFRLCVGYSFTKCFFCHAFSGFLVESAAFFHSLFGMLGNCQGVSLPIYSLPAIRAKYL